VTSCGDDVAANGGSITLPNKGRESHSYLYHIVKNWDQLADRTVFMQDRLPSCGFFLADGTLGDHLMTNVSVNDYFMAPLGASGVVMPLTMRFNANLTVFSMRSTFADLQRPQRQQVRRQVPQTPEGSFGDAWLPWEVNDFQTWIGETAKKTTHNASLKVMPYREFFENVFNRPPPEVVYFSQGGQFAATREAIQRTPKDKYEWILRQIEEGHEEMVYYMEASWFYLMTGPDHPTVSVNESVAELPDPSKVLPFLSHLPKRVLLNLIELDGADLSHSGSLKYRRNWINSLTSRQRLRLVAKEELANPWHQAFFQHMKGVLGGDSTAAHGVQKDRAGAALEDLDAVDALRLSHQQQQMRASLRKRSARIARSQLANPRFEWEA
jgi:hypothetical protein